LGKMAVSAPERAPEVLADPHFIGDVERGAELLREVHVSCSHDVEMPP